MQCTQCTCAGCQEKCSKSAAVCLGVAQPAKIEELRALILLTRKSCRVGNWKNTHQVSYPSPPESAALEQSPAGYAVRPQLVHAAVGSTLQHRGCPSLVLLCGTGACQAPITARRWMRQSRLLGSHLLAAALRLKGVGRGRHAAAWPSGGHLPRGPCASMPSSSRLARACSHRLLTCARWHIYTGMVFPSPLFGSMQSQASPRQAARLRESNPNSGKGAAPPALPPVR
jgi:hypothetical protein